MSDFEPTAAYEAAIMREPYVLQGERPFQERIRVLLSGMRVSYD